MIPKIIHYCWFGGNSIPEKDKKCIESWKKFCPDYEIIEWNENNFDINCCQYVKEAYEAKKWAFVSDYARIYALYLIGGIYLDTDVELLSNFDKFLSLNAFTGFENIQYPFTAVVGSEKNGKFVEDILLSYKNRKFIKENGEFDTTTNTETVTNLLVDNFNIKKDNTFQCIKDYLTIYPNDYFCPKNYYDGKVYLTKNSIAIHWYNGSWQSDEQKEWHNASTKLSKVLGQKISDIILGVFFSIKKEGFFSYIKNRLKQKS